MLINSLLRVLLSCIKFLGNHPCPRCLVEKVQIAELGTSVDAKRREQSKRTDDKLRRRLVERARHKIYVKGTPVNSKIISKIIGIRSLTPTRVRLIEDTRRDYLRLIQHQNSFSQLLGPHGADFHRLFIVDLLHKFELGVWQATFTHLIRILYAQGGNGIQELNWRYDLSLL